MADVKVLQLARLIGELELSIPHPQWLGKSVKLALILTGPNPVLIVGSPHSSKLVNRYWLNFPRLKIWMGKKGSHSSTVKNASRKEVQTHIRARAGASPASCLPVAYE